MEEVTKKRVLRKLEALPEEQLYQVLDYVEFLEMKYARAAARPPDAFQRFAERVEDQMRVRALAPRAMRGTMRIMSTAGKVLDGVRDLGRDIVSAGEAATAPRPSTTARGAAGPATGGPPPPAAPKAEAPEANGRGPGSAGKAST